MTSAFYEGFKYVCLKYGVDPVPLFKAAATAAAATPAKGSSAAGAPKGTPAGAPPAPKAATNPSAIGGMEGYRLGRQGKTPVVPAPAVSKAPTSPQTKTPAPVAKPVVKTPPASTGGVENVRRRWDATYNQGQRSQNPNGIDPSVLRNNIRNNIEAYKRVTSNPFGTANPFDLHKAMTTGEGPYAGWAENARQQQAARPLPSAPSASAAKPQAPAAPTASKPVSKPYFWRNASGRNFQTMDEAKFMDQWNKGTDQQKRQAMSGIGVNRQMWEGADDAQRMLWRRQAADNFYANRVRNSAARAANFGVKPGTAPSQNFYRPVAPGSKIYVNAQGRVISGNQFQRPAGSLLGSSPFAVAGWNGRNMELNGRHYIGQSRFAPGTRVINPYGFA